MSMVSKRSRGLAKQLKRLVLVRWNFKNHPDIEGPTTRITLSDNTGPSPVEETLGGAVIIRRGNIVRGADWLVRPWMITMDPSDEDLEM